MGKTKEKPAEVLACGQVVWARNAKGDPICNSPKRLGRGRCQVSVGLFQNGRCNDHGGPVPKGIEHPRFIHGKQSMYADLFTGEQLEEFNRLREHGEYYRLTDEIAVARLGMRDALTELHRLPADALKRFTRAVGEAEELLAGEYDETDLEAHLETLVELGNTVLERHKAVRAVEGSVETVRKLVESENKRLLGEQEQIPANKALWLFMSLRDSVRIHVWEFLRYIRVNHPQVFNDKNLPNPLRNIQEDVKRLLPTEVEPARTVHAEGVDPTALPAGTGGR